MEDPMETSEVVAREGRRLLRAGVLVFLFSLLVGLGVPRFGVPRLALSAHLLGVMQGTFLMVVGLLWPKLRLTGSLSRAGHALAIYGCFAAWTANVCAAVWRAGSPMLPMAAGGARGSALQEGAIRVLLMTSAASLITVTVLILWGLRTPRPSE